MTSPLVSIIIPARNEESDIEECLRAVLAQDHPLDRMEVVVVDGGSTDRTAEIARSILDGAGVHRALVVENARATTPTSLNVGFASSTGEVICRVDARSIVPPHYVRTCADILQSRPDVAVVGGSQVARARSKDAVALGIARALNNRYAMGWSRYRRGAPSGRADTVYLGAFRAEDLRAEGGWNESFDTNQDFELNRRMGQRGTVWFESTLAVAYVPRGDLLSLFRQYHRFGRWKVRYWRRTGDRPQPRQLMVLAAPLVALAATTIVTRRGPRALASWCALGAGGTLVIDAVGTSGPQGPVQSRVAASLAMSATSMGWATGALVEALRPADG